MNLDRVTKSFHRAYIRKVNAIKSLETAQSKLFDAFDKDLANQPLSRKSVTIPESENTEDFVKRYYPGFRVIGQVGQDVVLEENPALMSYTHVNQEIGMVFGRDRTNGSPSLDDERLREKDPELWERISDWPEPWWSLVRDLFQRLCPMWNDDTLNHSTATYLAQHGVQRVIANPNKLTAYDWAQAQEYILPGSVGVRLRPPRPIKPEDIGE